MSSIRIQFGVLTLSGIWPRGCAYFESIIGFQSVCCVSSENLLLEKLWKASAHKVGSLEHRRRAFGKLPESSLLEIELIRFWTDFNCALQGLDRDASTSAHLTPCGTQFAKSF